MRLRTLHRTGRAGAGLLRVYALAGDRADGRGFLDVLVVAARGRGLRGATVLPAVAGFGRHGGERALDTALYRPERQPLVLEIVDDAASLEAFARDEVAPRNRWGRLVTLERVEVRSYHAGPDPLADPGPPTGAG